MSPIAAALLAAALFAAEPADGLVSVPCAFQPAFFETGSTRSANDWTREIVGGYYSIFEVFSPASRAQVTLIGIATDGGSERANRRLARRRAETLRRFLVARGVARSRIRTVARHAGLEEWPLSSTHGRAVVVDVSMPREDLLRIMPPGEWIC